MTDPEKTLPPRTANTPRNAIAWLQAHPAVSIPLGTFMLGMALGAWVF